MAKKGELTANQKKALAALLSEPTVTAAAEACGLTDRTLHHYLNDETFKAELRARQDALLAAVTSALVGLSGEAVQVLRGVLNDPKASHSAKTRAALGWLREKRQSVELQDLAQRVSALEQKILEVKR